MKTTVEIRDSLFRDAKALAASRGVPFREVVEEGLLHVVKSRRPAPGRFRLRDGRFKGKGQGTTLTWPEIRGMIYEGRGG